LQSGSCVPRACLFSSNLDHGDAFVNQKNHGVITVIRSHNVLWIYQVWNLFFYAHGAYIFSLWRFNKFIIIIHGRRQESLHKKSLANFAQTIGG
jgi:hypothetical protein